MTKSELITKLCLKNGLPKETSKMIVSIFFDSIAESLATGQRVEIRGLCSFGVKKYKSYRGLNPKTGEAVKVKPKKLPVFRCGQPLRERMQK